MLRRLIHYKCHTGIGYNRRGHFYTCYFPEEAKIGTCGNWFRDMGFGGFGGQ